MMERIEKKEVDEREEEKKDEREEEKKEMKEKKLGFGTSGVKLKGCDLGRRETRSMKTFDTYVGFHFFSYFFKILITNPLQFFVKIFFF